MHKTAFVKTFEEFVNENYSNDTSTALEQLIVSIVNLDEEEIKENKDIKKFLDKNQYFSSYDEIIKFSKFLKEKFDDLGISVLEHLSMKKYKLTDFWTDITNKTNDFPKTDIMGNGNYKISLKTPKSQISSDKGLESKAMFLAALDNIDDLQDEIKSKVEKTLNEFLRDIKPIGRYAAKGLRPLESKKNQKKLTDSEKVAKDILKIGSQTHARLTEEILSVLYDNKELNKYFVLESATGNKKFADKDASANTMIIINPDVKNLYFDVIELNANDSKFKKLADNLEINVSFKSNVIKKDSKSVGRSFYSVLRTIVSDFNGKISESLDMNLNESEITYKIKSIFLEFINKIKEKIIEPLRKILNQKLENLFDFLELDLNVEYKLKI